MSMYPPVPADISLPAETDLLDQLSACVMETQDSFPTSCPRGCEVEPDGICQHGHPAWLRRYGLI